MGDFTHTGASSQKGRPSAVGSISSGLRRRVGPRVRRATAELSVMNPEAPKAQQVRRVVLWCALFSIGLFCSLLLLIVVDTAENSRGRSPANLSDAQLVEQVGLSQLSKSQRIGALDEIGRRRLSALKNTPLLFDGPEIAIAFAKAAAQVGDVALVPALMKQLDDSDATVRSSSTQALGILGDKRTAEFLKVRAARETNPAVREKMKAAIEALGN